MATVKVDNKNFKADVLDAQEPVVVDFWAEWCGPCKSIAPALEEMAVALTGRLTIAKLNIDENPTTPRKYGVRGIPTLMLFKDGQVAATKIGALPKNKLLEWVEREEAEGEGEAAYPPNFPKMPGEPKRVQPSRAKES